MGNYRRMRTGDGSVCTVHHDPSNLSRFGSCVCTAEMQRKRREGMTGRVSVAGGESTMHLTLIISTHGGWVGTLAGAALAGVLLAVCFVIPIS